MELSRSSNKPQRDNTYFKRIAQVEFNAWHYVGGDLWASLVAHIFEHIKIGEDEPPSMVDARRKAILDKIEAEKNKERFADQEEVALRKEITELEEKEANLTRQIQEDEQSLEAQVETLKGLDVGDALAIIDLSDEEKDKIGRVLAEVNTGVDSADQDAKALLTELTRARNVIQRGIKVFAPLLHARPRWKSVLVLGVVLLSGPGVGAVLIAIAEAAGWSTTAKQIATLLGTVGTLLSTGAAWVGKQSQWVNGWLDRAETGIQLIETRSGDKREERLEVRRRIADLQTGLGTQRERHKEAGLKIEQLKEELDRTTAARVLAEFIRERAESRDYRKHLGLPALIRRDFERLSDAIHAQNKELEDKGLTEADAAKKEADVPVNRIVLYIDDLDRCDPEKVVQVLQAVHLLLAFPLFVVVVAVDARWVSDSLRAHYDKVLANSAESADEVGFGRHASPHDYLEKIFQIPFWLTPIGNDGRHQMIRGLVKPARQLTKQLPGMPSPMPTPASQSKTTEQKDAKQTPPKPNKVKAKQTPVTPPDAGSAHPPELNPQSLQITEPEFNFMHALSPLLGRSPRALKRFVNVYLLIKSGLRPREDAGFLVELKTATRYKIVMFLLAVATGMPSLSRDFFTGIMALSRECSDPEGTPHTLGSVKGKLNTGEDKRRLMDWIETAEDGTWLEAALTPFAEEAAKVARFSFRIERLERN
jgi:hypothetical protein